MPVGRFIYLANDEGSFGDQPASADTWRDPNRITTALIGSIGGLQYISQISRFPQCL